MAKFIGTFLWAAEKENVDFEQKSQVKERWRRITKHSSLKRSQKHLNNPSRWFEWVMQPASQKSLKHFVPFDFVWLTHSQINLIMLLLILGASWRKKFKWRQFEMKRCIDCHLVRESRKQTASSRYLCRDSMQHRLMKGSIEWRKANNGLVPGKCDNSCARLVDKD